MDLSRRELLGKTMQGMAVVTTAQAFLPRIAVEITTRGSKEKKETSVARYQTPGPEVRKEMAEKARRFSALSRWMTLNHEAIFNEAPRGREYAVGIYKGPNQMPDVLYFAEQQKALQFAYEHKKETTVRRSRNHGDYILMY